MKYSLVHKDFPLDFKIGLQRLLASVKFAIDVIGLMMRKNTRISKSDWLVVIVYWSIAYVYIIPVFFVKGRIIETALLSLIEISARTFLAFMILYFLFPKQGSVKSIVLALLQSTLIILALTPFFMIGDAYYNHKTVDWGLKTIAINLLSEAQEIGILCAILAMKRFYNMQQYTQNLEKLNIENQLKALNNQVSPHFLFNNLNILSGLISQNPTRAQEYLNRLAMVYRHLITNANNDIVLLVDEVKFADDYIYLLQQRFESAYVFNKEVKSNEDYDKFLPTCSLQLVLENIIKHNRGDNLNPLQTNITITSTDIIVSNQKKQKVHDYDTTGLGLKNLRNRYELLSDKRIEIIETDTTYTIKLPLLTISNHKA